MPDAVVSPGFCCMFVSFSIFSIIHFCSFFTDVNPLIFNIHEYIYIYIYGAQ